MTTVIRLQIPNPTVIRGEAEQTDTALWPYLPQDDRVLYVTKPAPAGATQSRVAPPTNVRVLEHPHIDQLSPGAVADFVRKHTDAPVDLVELGDPAEVPLSMLEAAANVASWHGSPLLGRTTFGFDHRGDSPLSDPIFDGHLVPNTLFGRSSLFAGVARRRLIEVPHAVDFRSAHPHLRDIWRTRGVAVRYFEILAATPFDDPDYGEFVVDYAVALREKEGLIQAPVRINLLDPHVLADPHLAEERLSHLHSRAIREDIQTRVRPPIAGGAAYYVHADVVIPRSSTDRCVLVAAATDTFAVDVGLPEERSSQEGRAHSVAAAVTQTVRFLSERRTGDSLDRLRLAARHDAADIAIHQSNVWKALCQQQSRRRPNSGKQWGMRDRLAAAHRVRSPEVPAALQHVLALPDGFRALARQPVTVATDPNRVSMENCHFVMISHGPDNLWAGPLSVVDELGLPRASVIVPTDRYMHRVVRTFRDVPSCGLNVISAESFTGHTLNLPRTNEQSLLVGSDSRSTQRTLALALAAPNEIIVGMDDDIDVNDLDWNDLRTAIAAIGPAPKQFDVIWMPVTKRPKSLRGESDHTSTAWTADVARMPAEIGTFGGFGIVVARAAALSPMMKRLNEDWQASLKSMIEGRFGMIGRGGQLKTVRIRSAESSIVRRIQDELPGEIWADASLPRAVVAESFDEWYTSTTDARFAFAASLRLFADLQLARWIFGRRVPNKLDGVANDLRLAAEHNRGLDVTRLTEQERSLWRDIANWERPHHIDSDIAGRARALGMRDAVRLITARPTPFRRPSAETERMAHVSLHEWAESDYHPATLLEMVSELFDQKSSDDLRRLIHQHWHDHQIAQLRFAADIGSPAVLSDRELIIRVGAVMPAFASIRLSADQSNGMHLRRQSILSSDIPTTSKRIFLLAAKNQWLFDSAYRQMVRRAAVELERNRVDRPDDVVDAVFFSPRGRLPGLIRGAEAMYSFRYFSKGFHLSPHDGTQAGLNVLAQQVFSLAMRLYLFPNDSYEKWHAQNRTKALEVVATGSADEIVDLHHEMIGVWQTIRHSPLSAPTDSIDRTV